MRGGLSTIQQTLTPEASAVLAASVAEAARRSHGQTTPLHVAASLLAAPSGFLRNACVRSHPNSSHPLQCRALELCFSVALDRLPATLSVAGSHTEGGGAGSFPAPAPSVSGAGGAAGSVGVPAAPPVSNALMAALKRAQANQRRGCPEQQQQPLLAVKVELEQLVISILDDPSVSRVMREASFSSPAVKAAVESSISLSPHPHPGFRPAANMYLNTRLQQPGPAGSNDETRRVFDILTRPKRRNPVLVGENEPREVMNEVRTRLEKGGLNGVLEHTEFVRLDKAKLGDKLAELGAFVEEKIGDSRVVLDLGDLRWLVEAGRAVIDEVAKIVARFGERGNGRLWLIGTATCETYLRCQVYYPTMETDWDLQAVPITPRSPFPGMFPRHGGNGNLNSSVDPIIPMKTFQSTNAIPRRVPESLDPTRPSSRCPQCTENYEQELAKLVANEYEISSAEIKSKPATPPLPQWLQNAKSDNDNAKSAEKSQTKDQEMAFKQKTEELQKKWSGTCLRIHPSFHNNLGSQRVGPPMTLFNPKLLLQQPLQNRLLLNKSPGVSLQLNSCAKNNDPSEKLNSPPRSPVRTELALGRPKLTAPPLENNENNENDRVKDLLGCISSEFHVGKFAKAIDTDTYKRLLKGLLERVWWQKEAASAVASAVTKCREGNGKRRGNLSKGDAWILFTGPDRVGKKKMASVISEQICGSNPINICLGRRRSDEEIAMNFRGKTVLDRIVEAVKRNPFSVIILEDIDEADLLMRGNIKRAMERGRLADSYGREISLGNIIFILTANWLPDSFKKLSSDQELDENKLKSVSNDGWNLRLRISEKRAKRRADWLHDGDRLIKPRRELNSGLSFDLNLMADFDDNASDLTADHDDDQIRRFSITSVPIELANFIDEAVVFKPVEANSVKNEIKTKISEKFSNVVDDVALEIDDEALEKITGGVWLGRTGLEEWGEKVLLPSFHSVKTFLPFAASSEENFVVRLEMDSDSDTRPIGDCLPNSIRV